MNFGNPRRGQNKIAKSGIFYARKVSQNTNRSITYYNALGICGYVNNYDLEKAETQYFEKRHIT